MIYHNQAKYYEALQQSHNKGDKFDCRPFIDFMLDVIENAMYRYVDIATETNNIENDPVNDPGKLV